MFLSKIRTLWNTWEQTWELRTLVLFSLSIQVLLIRFGSSRKHVVHKLVSLLLWLGYLLADSVATFALGVLSNNEANEHNDLQAFWAPFLLLHLGGPDSITAFSLEDNELWLRHFLGLTIQVGVALYIFITTLWASKLWLVTIVMFVAGIIKYSERTWALMVASRENFRESMVTDPDPGPNYAKFMEEYRSKKEAGLKATINLVREPESQLVQVPQYDNREESKIYRSEKETKRREQIIYENLLSEAHHFFPIFKRLIVDLILTFHDRNESRSYFMKRSWKEAYKVIEIELGFVYEVLYTKAAVNHTIIGGTLRIVSVFSVTSAFLLFLFIDKSKYQKIDVVITYVLLGGAIALELWSLTRLFFSEWTIVWMKKSNLKLINQLSTLLFKVVSYFRPFDQPRWSNSMAQFNLIHFCVKHQPSRGRRIMKHVRDNFDKFWYRTSIKVVRDPKPSDHQRTCKKVRDPKPSDHHELEKSIFEDLKKKLSNEIDSTSYKYFSTCRGELALRKIHKDDFPKIDKDDFPKIDMDIIDRSIKVEVDESILLWHIATDICFYVDLEKNLSNQEKQTILLYQGNSIALSNYLLYLLVSRPFMLTAGIGQIRFGDTCAEAKNFFHGREIKMDKTQACKKLHRVNTEDVAPIEVKGDRSKSVLFDASRLAKSLLKLDSTEKRWEIISLVWFEILYYTASHCRGNYHAQRLSHGGEFLTFVWFLLVHLGIGEQYRVESGHARAKLIVEM